MEPHLWQAEWQGAKTYIVVGFYTSGGKVIDSPDCAPIARWMVGKPISYVLRQIKPYGGKIRVIG
jgi:hypothetical protein